jgi:hypothetical protein
MTYSARVMSSTGSWPRSPRKGKRAEPALHAEALARLAELRLAQGRIEEAMRLVEGYEDDPAAARTIGAIHLARDEPAAAASVLGRRLRETEEGSLEGAAISELLVEAEIGQGALGDAAARAERLAELACGVGSQLLTGVPSVPSAAPAPPPRRASTRLRPSRRRLRRSAGSTCRSRRRGRVC